jgi:acetylornithine deacetylase/succinyl-diaminopimelate desuccinylase-like protein
VTIGEAAPAKAIDPALEGHLEATTEARHAAYLDFLRIPSISALPQHAADCRRAAEWLVGELQRIGIPAAEVSETTGHPVVYAEWLGATDAPTVLVYGHYDVQPVDPVHEWETAPFEPFIRYGRVVGRGSADDKGQISMHLAAAGAFLATRGKLPLNLKFLFEGEEESSSEHLEGWVRANQDRLSSDAVIISDTGFFEGNVPALTLGLRGLLYTQVDVRGCATDVHSGGYGGVVENPVNALARIIAELKDRDGRVQVPGFYDDVVELTAEERAAIAAMPLDEAQYLEDTGAPSLHGEAGFSVLERVGYRPTLDVNGIWGGFQGEGSKTIIPATAHAKISCRLVPDQDPEALFERFRDHVLAVAPPGVDVRVQNLGTGRPSVVSPEHPVAKAAARALAATFGVEPLYIRSGGSIPVAQVFETVLGRPPILLGFTNPDDHAHAPNEFMRMGNYETGIRTLCWLWDDLASMHQIREAVA